MAFGKVTKEDIEGVVQELFGMPAADVKAKLSKIETVESTLNDVRGLAAGQGSVLEEIKTNISAMRTPYNSGGNPPPPDNSGTGGTTPNYTTRWDEDADKAFLERAQTVIAPALLDTRAMLAKREAMEYINAEAGRLKDKGVNWTMLEKEIEEKSKDSPLASKAVPQFWKNVYYACLGEKYPEIERDRASKSGRFYTESASSSIIVDPGDNLKPEDKLTQDQLVAARKSGLSPAEFAKELAGMTIVGR
jgi:hypothetical protein